MKLDRFPFVSVIMPVFNGEKYLNEAIESILNQTYTNFEFIIINDGSTDTSEEIILSYKDSRIVYIKNPENYKLIQTLNIGFSLAKGRYIARMDADDISHPDRLQKQVQFLDVNEDYGLVGTGVNLFHGANKSQLLYHTDNASLKFALAFYCPFIHPSIMLRKEVIKDMDVVFDSNYVHAEDYELWTRLSFITKMANLPEYLLDYRIHDAQISSLNSLTQIELANTIRANYLKYYFHNKIDNYSFVFNLLSQKQTLENKLLELLRLYQLDKVNNVFGGDNLNRYLIKRWKDLFLESEKLTLKTYFYFVSSSITYRSTWTLKQLISVFVKTFK